MLVKPLVVVMLVASTVFAEFGMKGFGGLINGAGFSGGGGIFGQFMIDRYFSFYPGVDIFYFTKEKYGNRKFIEVDFNFDLKASISFERLKPYGGLGFTPIASCAFKSSVEDTTFQNYAGGQIFLGCDYPIWKRVFGLFEFRIKFLSEYDAVKFSTGILF